MAKDKAEVAKLIDALESLGHEPCSYSGRGMYGKHCVSVSGEGVSAWNIAKDLFSEEYDGEFDSLPEPKQDSMGLGTVLYWPSYEWPKDGE